MSDHHTTDVLVIGAGPVGLLLAAELALGGTSVRVLEKTTEPSSVIKAGSINLASAEILARRGLLLKAREAHRCGVGKVAEAMEAAWGLKPERAYAEAERRVERAGHFAAIPLSNDHLRLDDPDVASHLEALDATLVVQRDVELMLEEHALALQVPIQHGVEIIAIEQTEDAVLAHSSAGELFQARYLVGCDGGRSMVRKTFGFKFPGTDPEITGRQAVVELENASLLKFGWTWSTRGVYRYGPTPGVVLTVEFGGPPADRTSEVSAEEIEQSLQRISGTDVRVTRLLRESTRWTDNARQASTYRKERIFLAGDAAHVHSPFSGQGLNCGLGDATNLGWKLAAVCTGRSPDSLLDTYTPERHLVGAWVLDWTRGQVAAMRPDVKVGQTRAVLADMMNTPDGMTQMVNKISGIAWQIDLGGCHRLIGRVLPDITLADGRSARELFTSGQFVLLDTTPQGDATRMAGLYPDRIATNKGAFQTNDTSITALLARPDGVIVWVAEAEKEFDAEGLQAALLRWVGGAGVSTGPVDPANA